MVKSSHSKTRMPKSTKAHITIIVGLPGAGKTTLFKKIKRKCTGLCVDDFIAEVVSNSPIERSKHFNDSVHYLPLIKALRKGQSCLIADIVFCDTLVRHEVETILSKDIPGLTIEWLFFKNSPLACRKNVLKRRRATHARELELIRVLSKKYVIPVGSKVQAVHTTA